MKDDEGRQVKEEEGRKSKRRIYQKEEDAITKMGGDEDGIAIGRRRWQKWMDEKPVLPCVGGRGDHKNGWSPRRTESINVPNV
jgi:hypothetical protein